MHILLVRKKTLNSFYTLVLTERTSGRSGNDYMISLIFKND